MNALPNFCCIDLSKENPEPRSTHSMTRWAAFTYLQKQEISLEISHRFGRRRKSQPKRVSDGPQREKWSPRYSFGLPNQDVML